MSDLISRQDAIDACLNGWNKGYDEILTDIRALPSADAVQIPIKLEKRYPQSRDEDITDAFMRGYLAGRSSADRSTGEWIEDGYCDRNCVCSHCGGNSGTQFDGVQPIQLKTKFCPNCGAKMGGDIE